MAGSSPILSSMEDLLALLHSDGELSVRSSEGYEADLGSGSRDSERA